MNQLFRLLVGICLRRLGPQDLPYSVALLRGLVLVAVGLQVLFSLLLRGEVAVHRLLLGVVLTLALPWLVLQWRQRGARYVQTLTALVGTGILFAIAMAPLLWLSVDLPPPSEGTPPTPRQALVSIVAICLVAWKIAVDGHIWRHALGWPLAGGVLLALGLFLLELGIEQVLFPVALQ